MAVMKIRALYFADPEPSPAAGDGAQAPDVERLVNWNEETDGPIPDDLKAIPVEHVREYVNKRATTVAAETEAQVRQRLLDEQERERGAQQTRAEIESEIAWAEDLDKRRNSSEAATREAAVAEYTRNEERYVKARASGYTLRQQIATGSVLEQFFRPQFTALAEAGHREFVEKNLPAMTQEHGSVLAATLAYGKGIGDAEGYARGLEEGKRGARVEENAGGAQGGGDPRNGGGSAPQIDMTRPGAGARLVREQLQQRAQRR